MNNNNLGVNYSDQSTQGSQSSNNKQPLTQVHTPQYFYQINQVSNGDSNYPKQIPQKANPSRLDPAFKEKNKAMYNSSMNFGTNGGDAMSSLSFLARKVNEPIVEKDQYLTYNASDKYNNNLGLPAKDLKMASSAIFGLDNAAQNDMNRFPAFNLGPNQNYNKPTEYSSATKNQTSTEPKSKENAKQKRDRELQEMKKQLEDLSKKIKTVEQKNKTTDNSQSNSNNQSQKSSVAAQSQSYQSIPAASSTSNSGNNYNFSNKFQQYKNLPNTPNLNEPIYKNQQSLTAFNDQSYTQSKKNQQTYYNQTNYSTSQKQQTSNQKPKYNYDSKYDQYEKKYENNSKNNGNNSGTSYDTYSSFKVDSLPKNQPNNYSTNQYANYNYANNTNKSNTDNLSYDYKPRSISTASTVPESKSYEYNYAPSTNTPSTATSVPSASNQGVFKKKKNNVEVYENQTYKSDAFSKKVNEDLKKPEYYPETSTTTINYQRTGSIRKIQSFNYQDPNIPIKELKKIKFSDFIIGKKMGKGMFGEVLLVKHKQTGWVCGLKVMEKRVIKQQNYMGQIARQLSIQFYLQHRNILSLYGYFQDEKNFYLLIEFCSGGQLLQRLKQQRRMNERDVALIIKQVCEGVDYIHKELIIHRDIKPENILFNMGIVKICDFGWAVYRGFGLRKTASGSPLYYPPEIVKGQEYDDKIDIWCIGMMAYECIMGKIPFKVYTQMDLKRIVSDEITFPEWVDVTDDFKDFILKTLKKNPDERMEIRQMLRHPFLAKHQEAQLSKNILDDFKRVLG